MGHDDLARAAQGISDWQDLEGTHDQGRVPALPVLDKQPVDIFSPLAMSLSLALAG